MLRTIFLSKSKLVFTKNRISIPVHLSIMQHLQNLHKLGKMVTDLQLRFLLLESFSSKFSVIKSSKNVTIFLENFCWNVIR